MKGGFINAKKMYYSLIDLRVINFLVSTPKFSDFVFSGNLIRLDPDFRGKEECIKTRS